MSRRPRIALTDYPLHIVQRGNDRQPCFFGEADRRTYLQALHDASAHYGVQIHAYVLMSNHVHLLATPRVVGAVSRMMQSVGARYVGYVNATYGRTGTLWEGRYHACLVDDDAHVLNVCRYIDLNPVRARMVAHPIAWPWSSYGALVGERADALVVPHPALELLGTTSGAAYANWCALPADDEELAALRAATGSELAYGSDAFRARIDVMTGRSAKRRRRERSQASAPE